MKQLFTLMLTVLAATLGLNAQVITTSPSLLQESSTNVVLTFHADRCDNPELMNLPASTPLYVHIGTVTDKSNSTWVHVMNDWNNPVYQLTYVSPNTYTLNIGNIRQFFAKAPEPLTDPNEHVTKIAFIARSKAGAPQTKDYFIDVLPEGFQMALTSDVDNYVISAPTTINFEVSTTLAANITLKLDGSTVASANNAKQLTKQLSFSQRGFKEVEATAVYNGQTYTKKVTVAYPNPSAAQNYPGGTPKMGAVKNSDGTVTFCLAAPQKSNVMIIPSWDNYQALDKNVMKYQDYQGNRYFWITVSGLANDKPYPYYYLVDGVTKVADPYARLVLDVHSDKWLKENVYPSRPRYPYDIMDDTMLAVYQGNLLSSVKFSNFQIPDHRNLVIYEMLLRDWTGTDSTDDGTIAQAIEKIPHLVALGVNCVELLPVMEFNGNNSWGYNPNFYFALDKSYGSPAEFQRFVEICHSHGIAVVLDIALNHSDGLHPWYQMYPAASNPFYNATAPHEFSVLNDWRQENPIVKQQWQDVVKFWMTEYNVDGFRFDLVKGLGDSNSYGAGTSAKNQSRINNMKAIHAAMRSVKPNAIHINEAFTDTSEENELFTTDGQLGWANCKSEALNYAYGNGNNNISGLWSPNWSRPKFATVSYPESHDEQRLGYKALQKPLLKSQVANRAKRLASIGAISLMTPGPKMIWQFAELGADENTKQGGGDDGDNITDPKPVYWNRLDDADFAGICKSYGQLGWIRRANPELFENDNVTYQPWGFNGQASEGRYIRLASGDKELVLCVNTGITGTKTLTPTPAKITASNYAIIASSKDFTATPTFSGSQMSIAVPANSFVVIGTKAMAGLDDVIADEVGGNNVTVAGGAGEIIISGDYTSAAVYSLDGRQMPSLSVPAGIYIVNVDGTAQKVLVK